MIRSSLHLVYTLIKASSRSTELNYLKKKLKALKNHNFPLYKFQVASELQCEWIMAYTVGHAPFEL